MTALTLTAQLATASVLVQITGAPAGPVVITCTDANGSRVVRLRDGQEPIAGALTVQDVECALTGLLRYEVTDSAAAVTVATITLNATLPVISLVALPQDAVTVSLVTGYAATRTADSTVHEVIGRDDWLVTIGALRARRGPLTIWCADYAAAAALAGLCALREPMMLRQPTHPGMDMYFTPESVTVEPDQTRWRVILTYVEVRRPSGPLLGAAGWTCASVAAYGSCQQIKSTFATCSALVVGP